MGKKRKIEYTLWCLSKDKCPSDIYVKLRYGYYPVLVNRPEFNNSIYEKIFTGESSFNNAHIKAFVEAVIKRFNIHTPIWYHGPSLSVGDIVTILDEDVNSAWIICTHGLAKVEDFL